MSTRFRPRMEALEGREVPAIVVNSTRDLGDSDLSDGVASTGFVLPDGQAEVTLRAAIQHANGAGALTIDFSALVANGTPATIRLTRPMDVIRTSVTIDGIDRNLLTISRDMTLPAFHYFTLQSGYGLATPVVFKNMTVRHAVARPDQPLGGAFHNNNRLALDKVNLIGNKAESGGAVYNGPEGQLTITDCYMALNEATGANGYGGAIFGEGHSRTTITGSTLSFNSSRSQGGAIGIIFQSRIQLFDTHLIYNDAFENGGAVYASVGNMAAVAFEMRGGSVLGNYANDLGGGFMLSSANARVEDVLFKENQATRGGAIWTRLNSLDLVRCTFGDNVAGHGPDVVYSGNLGQTVFVTLTDCSITMDDVIEDL
jgi:hypothetical protein